MIFNHVNSFPLKELKTESIDGKRYYLTPNGKYPSITTILSSFPKPHLQEWKNRVGKEQSDYITKTAANKGTKVHKLSELYLLNEKIDKSEYMPDVLDQFYSFKSLLNNINNIHYLEAPLYSNRLKFAGRTDCIGEYEGVLSIIDFKTSRRLKKEEWITDYFLQTTAYGLAYFELTGIKPKQIVILIAVENDFPQVFIKPIGEFIEPLIVKIRNYYGELT